MKLHLNTGKKRPTCSHRKLQFGCAGCIERETQESIASLKETFAPPSCRCGEPMLFVSGRPLPDNSMELSYECPQISMIIRRHDHVDVAFRHGLEVSSVRELA